MNNCLVLSLGMWVGSVLAILAMLAFHIPVGSGPLGFMLAFAVNLLAQTLYSLWDNNL